MNTKKETTKELKTFEDLVFKPHPNVPYLMTQARMDFDNNYGVSVVTGEGAYSTPDSPYELAVMLNGNITYNTHITNDVIRHLNKEGVTEIMKQVQEL